MNINKCGKFYYIKKKETETTKQLLERSWYTVNYLHLDNASVKDENQFNEALRQGRLWSNITNLKVSYQDDIQKKIEDIEKKVFI